MATTQANQLRGAQTLYTAATKAEISGEFDKAFKLYVKAAEQFLHLGATAVHAASRIQCKSEAAKCVDRAEKIRKRKKDVAPVAREYLSEREQLFVLQKSSTVNGIVYPVWDGPFPMHPDTSQPKLSAEQTRQSACWAHAGDKYVICSAGSLLSPEDVSQHVISDCSFCASIAVCLAHNSAFRSTLGLSALFPQDQRGLPVPSSGHIYSVRLLFNGAYRRVDVDATLPHGPDRELMCLSTGCRRELWPALLEKAYMKLMGGYEFPGSLSSTDLYTLTGWIPEHIDIASPNFEREKTWRRIYRSFREGRCMITIGTGPEVRYQAIASTTLLPAHSYAVIDVVEDDRGRTLIALDPWQEQVEAAHAGPELDITRLSLDDGNAAISRIFEISWDLLCTVFDGLYVSWDPSLFKHTLDFHGMWKKDTNVDESFPSHFRLTLKLDEYMPDSQVWLLLTRHVVDSKRSGEFIALSLQEEFSKKGIADPSLKGEYTNNTQVLVRVTVPQKTIRLLVSYDGTHDDVGFSVCAFSDDPMSWVREEQSLAYSETVTGKFAARSAGGNLTLPTFMKNPQYHVRIHPDRSTNGTGNRGKKSRLYASLRGDRHIPLNVIAIWSQGQRIADFAHSDIALSSGAYSYGHASTASDLPAGDYTVVVSAFEPRHTGSYSLKLECSTRLEVVSEIPPEGAGMYCKPVRGSWTAETAAGAPQFQHYKANPAYELNVTSQSEVLVRLQLVKADPSISLNVSLYRLSSVQTLGPLIATSGAYSDAVCGVLLQSKALPMGRYAIVPSTFTPGACATFKMVVHSSTVVESIPNIPSSVNQ